MPSKPGEDEVSSTIFDTEESGNQTRGLKNPEIQSRGEFGSEYG